MNLIFSLKYPATLITTTFFFNAKNNIRLPKEYKWRRQIDCSSTTHRFSVHKNIDVNPNEVINRIQK